MAHVDHLEHGLPHDGDALGQLPQLVEAQLVEELENGQGRNEHAREGLSKRVDGPQGLVLLGQRLGVLQLPLGLIHLHNDQGSRRSLPTHRANWLWSCYDTWMDAGAEVSG